MSGKPTDPLSTLYASWIAAMHARPDMSLEAIRGLFEHWGDVTAEPGECDYILGSLGGVTGLWVEPRGCRRDKILLCAHGGGYVLGSMYTHRKLFGHFARRLGVRAFVAEYRRAPENVHPGPLNDMMAAYNALRKSGDVCARDILLLGDSAGGALAITMQIMARDLGIDRPAGSIALAPYLDMEAVGASYDRNAKVDALGSREGNMPFIRVFLGPDGDPHDSYANPLFANLAGLAPMFLQVGGYDVLEDDSVRFAERAKQAGTNVALEVVPAMPHVFQFLAGTDPEADAAIDRAVVWARSMLGLG